MRIRDFLFSDLEAVIQLAQISFAEEFMAQGLSPQSFSQQVRLATRGRMFPFKIATTLAGIKWHFFVAEVEKQFVGFGGYTGRKKMELGSLMVHPNFRRQGIGQALLKARLQHLQNRNFPFVTATVLNTNNASLGNLYKQGFELFDQYIIFEKPLPLPSLPNSSIQIRSFKPSDVTILTEYERQLSSEQYLELSGSMLSSYAPSAGSRILNLLTGSSTFTGVFENEEQVIGILSSFASKGQAKGIVYRPLILDEHLDQLPAMLGIISAWLTDLGKTTIKVTVAHNRKQLASWLRNQGWQETHTWVRVVKYL